MAENALNQAKLIVIGGSSGSLEALLVILPLLRRPFPLPILLVMHRGSQADNTLSDLLSTKTSLSVKEADDKDVLQAGSLYIAPPDYHVLPEADGTLSLDVSERINFSRPSIDVTLFAAAAVYREYLVAVLLSGANADGAEGMAMVKQKAGLTVVQDPATAVVSFMPEKAILHSPVDRVLSPVAIADLLNSMHLPG